MSKATELRQRFKQMMAGDKLVIAPGVYDGLTASLATRTGFDALYMTGAGTAAQKGYPDYGLLTMTEMVANAETIANVADSPVVADADTGYGNELNVTRTVQEYERAGVAAIHLEDQGFPKKCGHLDDKELIDLEDYAAKIRAAAAARRDKNFQIIARTDSRAVLGFEEALRRGNAALEAGADIVFVEAPQTMDELKAIPKEIKGPCLFNYVEGGKTPHCDMKTVQEMGFRLAILPGVLMRQVILACEGALATIKQTGEPPAPTSGMGVREIFERVGSVKWDKIRTEFAAETKQAAE
jgi:2-methylisocitrate lyase-like PEP mutase family enzyme